MKGINEWAKDLKHNESVAEKFVGVKTVSDIIAIAKNNGYEFTKKELMDFDLDSVSGGVLEGMGSVGVNVKADIKVIVQNANVSTTSTGNNSTTQSNPTVSMSNTKN